ncbi:hypothetical protein M426DRAFT_69242, partial [Hypoxylon sp. CI-4A]
MIERTLKVAGEGRINVGEESTERVDGRQLPDDSFFDIGDVHDVCPACTTPYDQAVESLPFKSSLRLSYNDPETHTWLIGEKYTMTETVGDKLSGGASINTGLAAELIRASTKVPMPTVLACWKENGKAITITERPSGQRLYDIWWEISEDERAEIGREVARYIKQWRQLTADRISNLAGGEVWHHDHLFGPLGGGFGPFQSDEELWEAIHEQLIENNVDKTIIQCLKEYMPESTPCVFTHGDLSCTNIFIENGKVSAITGFDNAACLPTWAEYIAAHFCSCKEDEQWKKILSRYMESHPREKDWW